MSENDHGPESSDHKRLVEGGWQKPTWPPVASQPDIPGLPPVQQHGPDTPREPIHLDPKLRITDLISEQKDKT